MSRLRLKKKVKFSFLFLILLSCLAVYVYVNKDEKVIIIGNDTTTTTTTVKKEEKTEVNLTFVGDLLFESPFYKAVSNGYDKNEYFSEIKDYLKNDDLSLGNMEVVIGNENLQVSGDGYNFCAPSYIGDLVSTLDFQVLSTANNHAYDRGKEGIISTLDYFSNTNIKTIGTHKDTEEDLILDIKNIKFGFLSYTYGTNSSIPTENKGMINVFKSNGTIDKERIKNDVLRLKEKSDILIVMMHWGIEFTFEANNEQKELAKYLNSLGVDIIYGSHSHSIQPVDIIGEDKKTLVFYSLGNFVSADDDIARTPSGQETFDNAYQFGLMGQIKLVKENNNIEINNVHTELIINYFDKDMNNFKLIPLSKYTEEYEKSHLRYSYGLNKEFINNTYNSVINEVYR